MTQSQSVRHLLAEIETQRRQLKRKDAEIAELRSQLEFVIGRCKAMAQENNALMAEMEREKSA